MASVKPFRAVRPIPEKAAQIASLPYDVMNREEAKALAAGNPLSFLHVVRSEIDLPEVTDVYAPEVYAKARENFDWLVAEGSLIQEEEASFYIYRQILEGRSQTGLVATVAVDEYLDGRIKRHELTRPEKEEDRIRNFDAVNAQTAPIFLTYRQDPRIAQELVAIVDNEPPLFDFTSDDGVRHTVWKLAETERVDHLEGLFGEQPALYIADGHHRSASAAKIGLKRRAQQPEAPAQAPFNRFLAVLFPHSDLQIYDYNRYVHDLNGLTVEAFLGQLSTHFAHVLLRTKEAFSPQHKGEFGLFLNDSWYRLNVREALRQGRDRAAALDVSLLQDFVLAPILAIEDPRRDQRIEFIGGVRGLGELERRVREKGGVAFALYPPTMDDLLGIADDGLIMPPKSTWFEPKLRSGLFIHRLEE